MTYTLTRTSTDNIEEVPPETLIFDTWINFPEPRKKIIETTRRLGSRHVIRQELGETANQTQSFVVVSFAYNDDADYDFIANSFLDDLRKAMDPTTYYTLSISEINPLTIERIMILDLVSVRRKIVRGITSPSQMISEDYESNRLVLEITMTTMVDADEEIVEA